MLRCFVFLLFLLVLTALGEDIDRDDFIGLVVGKVTSTDARILYWQFKEGEIVCSISLRPPVPSLSFLVLKPSDIPTILELPGLQADVMYTGAFLCESENSSEIFPPQHVTFHTPAKQLLTGKIMFQSCNRLAEQEDPIMWNLLAEKVAPSIPTLNVHLGDQIYADIIEKILAKIGDHQCIQYGDILNEFRSVYASSWNNPELRTILRKNGNLMLLDDHDIINNLNNEKWSTTDRKKKFLIRAGFQSFLEFQHQLFIDIPSFDFINHSEKIHCCVNHSTEEGGCDEETWSQFDAIIQSLELWGATRMGNVGLLHIDTRGDRTIHGEMVGAKQLNFIENHLKLWEADETIHSIIIASSIPIIYQSSLMAEVAYRFEGEKYFTHSDHLKSLNKVLDVFFQYPSKLVLVGGDIHMYFDSFICKYPKDDISLSDNLKVCLPQYITSGMTTKSSTIRSLHLYAYAFFAIQVFTPRVIAEVADYYLEDVVAYLDNSFIQFTFDDVNGNWEVFQRPMEGFYEQAMQILFEMPLFYYFALGCIFCNILVIIIFLLIICTRFLCFKPKEKVKKQ